MVIQIRSIESPETWEQAVRRVPHATVFHRHAWLECVTRELQFETFYGGVYAREELVGVFPVCIRRRGLFRVAGSPQGFSGSMIPYLGPAVPDELLGPTLEAFEEWQKERGIHYAELQLEREADPAVWKRFQYVQSPRRTVCLQLPPTGEMLWLGLASSCRRAIRKAESQGVEVAEVSDRQFLETYMDMSADVYAKTRRPPPISLSGYRAIWDALCSGKLLRVLAARRKHEVLAAAMFVLHPELGRAYYLDGVSYARHQEFRPNNLIHWTLLQQLSREGFAQYDMLGADGGGIERFKLSFGGSLRPHDYVFKARTPLARLARRGYQWLAPAGRFLKYHLGSRQKNQDAGENQGRRSIGAAGEHTLQADDPGPNEAAVSQFSGKERPDGSL